MYIYILHMYAYTYIHTYLPTYMHVYSQYISICVDIYIYMYNMYVLYVYMYVCICMQGGKLLGSSQPQGEVGLTPAADDLSTVPWMLLPTTLCPFEGVIKD